MEDLDLYADEEEEAAAEEGSNRTFIILVGALGGLLALAICAFVAWAFWLGPRMAEERVVQNQTIEATNAVAVEAAETGAETTTIPPTEEATTVPTDTPRPTPTKRPTATAVTATGTPGEAAEAPTVAPSPTATRRPPATPKPGSGSVPDTGVGALGGGALAVGLLFLLLVVRRMRRAT